MPAMDHSNTASNAAGKVAKVAFLSVFALILVITAVSFAVHHMRLGAETEFKNAMVARVRTDAKNAASVVSGEEINTDPILAAQKYSTILPFMLMDTNEDDYSTQVFGLYSYSNGVLTMLTGIDSDYLIANKIPVSDWLTAELTPYEVRDEDVFHYLVPILDQEGKVSALLELSAQTKPINEMGDKLESMILSTVSAAVIVAMAIFSLQYIVPPIVRFVSKNKTEASV
ncbi:MAG: hypothetical protein KBT07_09430 [Clostridiales bacterium]|nr:hypothetical protein [Candidatus Scatonaster coprocaballi]